MFNSAYNVNTSTYLKSWTSILNILYKYEYVYLVFV